MYFDDFPIAIVMMDDRRHPIMFIGFKSRVRCIQFGGMIPNEILHGGWNHQEVVIDPTAMLSPKRTKQIGWKRHIQIIQWILHIVVFLSSNDKLLCLYMYIWSYVYIYIYIHIVVIVVIGDWGDTWEYLVCDSITVVIMVIGIPCLI